MTINAINPLEDMDTYKRVRIYYDGLDRLVSPYVDIVERYNKAIENTTDEVYNLEPFIQGLDNRLSK